ncbi:MAG: amidohydrolase family protein [Rhodospirillaceae bacterium]|nr:amidohydrolase family protein [Rhodospirillaceae bacterium]
MFDLVIANGTIVDGTGKDGYKGDVGITGETIAAIGDLSKAETKRRIDATGHTVSPGFIDTHTHSEGALLVDPQHANGIRQGITTEFLGIDGMSYAPLSAYNFKTYRHWLGGLLGDPPEDLDMHSVAAFKRHYHKRVAINTAYFVPHATVRLQALGFHDKPLTGEALETAKKLTREGLEQGAIGFTTGGKYYPGPWGDTEEIVELVKLVREAGKVYMCEPRKNVVARAHGGGGVLEGMEVARRTGAKLHFAHYRTQPESAGNIPAIMDPIDGVRTAQSDVTFDIYPYPSGSSIAVSLLPAFAQEDGPKAILKRLHDPSERKKIVQFLDHDEKQMLATIILGYMPMAPEMEGTRLTDLAARRGRTPGEALCEVLIEQNLKVGHVGAPPESQATRQQMDRDFMQLVARPDYMVCSDITPAGRFPHPRSYGAFPRFLGRLRRDIGGLSLEEMVHRMTGRPAERFGLKGRGRIEKGAFADIAVFDAATINDTSTYENPRQFPIGIPYVIVNGQVAVDNERCTGVYAGQAI